MLFFFLVLTLAKRKPLEGVDPYLFQDFGTGTNNWVNCQNSVKEESSSKKRDLPNYFITDEEVESFYHDGVVGPFSTGVDHDLIDEFVTTLTNMTDEDEFAMWNPHLSYSKIVNSLVTESMVYK